MFFEYAQAKVGQSVLIHGAAGNVGAYAVQLVAKYGGLQVLATAGPSDLDYVRGLDADRVVDYATAKFEEVSAFVDAVLDTVGAENHSSY